jgi:hypothetical protein
MSANSFISKYATRNNKKAIVQYYKIPATTKWVEYMLDKHEINKILMNSNFTTKMDLLEILQVLERKIDYMYKHPNFDFKKATSLFQILKTAPKVVEVATKNVVKKQHKK